MEVLIEIHLCTTQCWLNKLGYEYKDVYKDVFIDAHRCLDIVEDHAKFLKVMKDLKPYIVEFEKDGTMKLKVYLNDCKVEGPN